MRIYLDADYVSHVGDDGGGAYTPWEDTDGFFAGKCKTFIEGFRVVPEGATWAREDGEVFAGQMIAPAVDVILLLATQWAYDEMRPELERLERRNRELEAVQDALFGMEANEDE